MVSQRLQVICLIDYFMQFMNPPGSTSHWLLPSGVAALSWLQAASVAIPHGTGQIGRYPAGGGRSTLAVCSRIAMQSMAIEDLDVKRTCIPIFAGFETFNSCA